MADWRTNTRILVVSTAISVALFAAAAAWFISNPDIGGLDLASHPDFCGPGHTHHHKGHHHRKHHANDWHKNHPNAKGHHLGHHHRKHHRDCPGGGGGPGPSPSPTPTATPTAAATPTPTPTPTATPTPTPSPPQFGDIPAYQPPN